MPFFSRFFSLSLFLFVSFSAPCQDTLIFINGKKINATNIKVIDNQVHYNLLRKPQKHHRAETYNIFSIKHQDGSETLLYAQDTMTDDFSLEQMRMFVKGQQDARQYYNTTATSVSSAAIGVSSGLFLQFFALAPPAIYATILGASSPNVDRQPIPERELLNSPEYRMGYETRARNLKIKKALIFGIGGAIIGYAAFRVAEVNDR